MSAFPYYPPDDQRHRAEQIIYDKPVKITGDRLIEQHIFTHQPRGDKSGNGGSDIPAYRRKTHVTFYADEVYRCNDDRRRGDREKQRSSSKINSDDNYK